MVVSTTTIDEKIVTGHIEANEVSRNNHNTSKVKVEPCLGFTSVPVISNIITGKTVQSLFLHQSNISAEFSGPVDKSGMTRGSNGGSGLSSDPTGANVIVLNPGSRHFRVGLAKDAFPKICPQVISHKRRERSHVIPSKQDKVGSHSRDINIHNEEMDEEFAGDEQDELALLIEQRLAQRYKRAKKKPPPNIYPSIISFNKTTEPQEIPSHNDAFGFDWTKIQGQAYVTGREAIRINPVEPYRLRYPMKRGSFNQDAYSSDREVIGDLDKIWTNAIVQELGIKTNEFNQYFLILVVPESLKRTELRSLIECGLMLSGFKAVSLITESIATTYGLGVSSACVIDLGAEKTHVVCVEDGMVLGESKIILPFGAIDLANIYGRILQHHGFKRAIGPNPLDKEVLNDLTEHTLTLDEEELSPQIFECCVRTPGQPTLLYPFKVFEERIIVPQCLFEPGVPLIRTLHELEKKDLVNDEWKNTRLYKYKDSSFELEQSEDELGANTGAIGDSGGEEPIGLASSLEEQVYLCKWKGCCNDLLDKEEENVFTNPGTLLQHVREVHLNDPHEKKCQWGTEESCFDKEWKGCDETSWICHLANHIYRDTIQKPEERKKPDFHSPPTTTLLPQATELDKGAYISLDEAILTSVRAASTNAGNINMDRVKRLLENLVLVGGGHQMPNFAGFLLETLERRLADTEGIGMFKLNDDQVVVEGKPCDDKLEESVEIPETAILPSITLMADYVPNLRDLDPRYISWKGGAVAAKLDSASEGWIGKSEWREYGAKKMMKDRLAFFW